MEPTRQKILEVNQQFRQGSLQKPVALDEGYVAMVIPTKDFKILKIIYPDLASHDHEIRLKAWKKLEASPLGEIYRVTRRSPNQVRRSNNHRIIVK